MADHLGYGRCALEGRGSTSSRNGSSPKRVATEIGEIDLRVPCDRAGPFEPVTVPKHQRRLDGLSGNVVSLHATGLTTGEIQAHLSEIYDTSASRETISKITELIVADMAVGQNRPARRGVSGSVDRRDSSQGPRLPGRRAARLRRHRRGSGGRARRFGPAARPDGGEGAKHQAAVLGELRNRGPADALIVCCDGLRGLPEPIRATWPEATAQTCVVHMAPTASDTPPKSTGAR